VDKIKRNQLCFIIVGLFLFSLGVYLISLRVSYYITSLVSLSGLTLVISGIRYKERLKRKKLTGNERTAYLNSGYFITTIIGVIIVFTGLGGGLIANYFHASLIALLFLGIVLVGTLIMVVARIVKVADKTKKIPA
jgi:hypothetical protein